MNFPRYAKGSRRSHAGETPALPGFERAGRTRSQDSSGRDQIDERRAMRWRHTIGRTVSGPAR